MARDALELTDQPADRPTGRLAGRLAEGFSAAGLFVMVAHPAIVEIAGLSGFDFVVVDTEHGPASTESVEHLVRAADTVGVSCLVRVPTKGFAQMQRALDAGAAGIVAPHVASRADAEALVAAVRYPPEGRRGFAGTARSGRYGFAPRQAVLDDGDELLAVAQIEDAEALDRLDEIAGTPGLNAVLVGPSDLSVSLGVRGAEFDQRLSALLERLTAIATGRGDLAVGCFSASSEQGRHLLTSGLDFVVLSSTAIIANAIRSGYQRLGIPRASAAERDRTSS